MLWIRSLQPLTIITGAAKMVTNVGAIIKPDASSDEEDEDVYGSNYCHKLFQLAFFSLLLIDLNLNLKNSKNAGLRLIFFMYVHHNQKNAKRTFWKQFLSEKVFEYWTCVNILLSWIPAKMWCLVFLGILFCYPFSRSLVL